MMSKVPGLTGIGPVEETEARSGVDRVIKPRCKE